MEVWLGDGRFGGKREVAVKLRDGEGEKRATAELVLINVGERPAMPDLHGLKEIVRRSPRRVLDSTSIQRLEEVPQSLPVLGGDMWDWSLRSCFRGWGGKLWLCRGGSSCCGGKMRIWRRG